MKRNEEEAINKRINEIEELKKLREYISKLAVSSSFINPCLNKIDDEIELQEYIYFRDLGEATYNAKKKKSGE